MSATEDDYSALFDWNVDQDNTISMARCACVACNSCTCACSCKRTEDSVDSLSDVEW